VRIDLRRTFHGELLLHLLRLLAISDQQMRRGAGSYILQVLRLLGVEWLRHFDDWMKNCTLEKNNPNKE
jgi:hypothetical protein